MRGIRTIIVDDEPLARLRLHHLLSRDPEINIIAQCVDAFDAVKAIHELSPDLIFLDIHMPEKDGFFVFDKVGIDSMPHTIFVTAYDQHALRAFECNALDYLLKPYDEEKFLRTLRRAKQLVSDARAVEVKRRVIKVLEQLRQGSDYLERILIKNRGRMFFLNIDEVCWIKSEGNYLKLNVGKASYLIRDTLNNFQSQVDPKKFIRIRRSTLVNVKKVKELAQMTHGDYKVMLYDGTELVFSRHYRHNLSRFESRPG